MARRSAEDIKSRRVGSIGTQIPIQAIDARDRRVRQEQEEEEKAVLSGEDQVAGVEDERIKTIHATIPGGASIDDEIERLAVNIVKIRNSLVKKGVPSSEVGSLVRAVIELAKESVD